MTLRGRLFLTIGLAVLLSVALSLGVGAFLARRSIQQAVETNLSRQVDLLAVRAETQPLSAEQLSGLRFFLGRQGERLVVTVRPVPAGLPVSAEQRSALDAGRAVQGELSLQGVPLLFAAHPTDNQVLLLVRPARLGAADWRPFLGSFLVAGLVGVAVAAAALRSLRQRTGRELPVAADPPTDQQVIRWSLGRRLERLQVGGETAHHR